MVHVLALYSAILLAFCAFQVQSDPNVEIQRKLVVVGDEFPSMSIGFLNNRTEYEVRLNTTSHRCTNVYVCEIFVTLTEMFCKNITSGLDQPYLEINGVISGNRNISVKWCREYGIDEGFAQDEFLKMRTATLTPKGDWSKTNASVLLMASFYEQVILDTAVVPVGDTPVELMVDTDSKQFEIHLNASSRTCTENQNDCSISAHIEMTCPENAKSSAELQLDVISINNETVSKILCPLKCTDANGVIKNISTYLVNVRTLIITPSGNWKSAKASASVSVNIVPGGTARWCPEKSFDCKKSCSLPGGRTSVTEPAQDDVKTRYLLAGSRDSTLRCVPWSWICGKTGECESMCESAQKFCKSQPTKMRKDDQTNINVYISNVRSYLYYYSFFLIPTALILIMLFGVVCMLRQRSSAKAVSSNEIHGTGQRIQLLGKLPKNIPYQMVENETL
ncbi:unnamed protein product [Allacma fusca]|uniref:Uncharacterized protein n=1 Tax=Allacma fusca TaxID=39272 RepID=A0A8J2NI47_9HEXA|nr:unnamed protein product [Allacma fusca]